MRRIIKLLLLLMIGPFGVGAQPGARLPATGRTLADFIPARYDTLPGGYAVGDLNHDGRPDVALALRPVAEDIASHDNLDLPPRLLVLLFGAPAGGYSLAGYSEKAVLARYLGGRYDEPFDALAITKGVLVLDQEWGGSAHYTSGGKLRYQQGNFLLIGETKSTSENGLVCQIEEVEDINFLTGAYETTTTNKKCEQVTRRGRRLPVALRKLADYEPMP